MTPHWQAWMLVMGAAFNTALANIMIKESRLRDHAPGLAGMIFSPLFVLGVGFFGASLLLSTKALEVLPVSLAYPVQAGFAFFFLVVIALLFMNEPLGGSRLIGITLILLGIVLAAR